MGSEMEIKEQRTNGIATLSPIGELDANSSIEMDEKISNLIDEGMYRIHVDCTGLSYISSAGLGVFISFMDELQSHGGNFVFSGMSSNIRKVFELLGLHEVMTIVETTEEAQEKLGG